MQLMVRRILQREVERQCRFSLMAEADIRLAVSSQDTDRLWYSLQAFLVAVGNISKLFWPGPAVARQRGEALRQSLQIPDDSPLQPRFCRNHFEHFDERIEAWASSTHRHNFADMLVGPSGALLGIDVSDILRHYDPAGPSLHFRGDTYELSPIIHALSALYPVVRAEAAKPHWL